MKFYYNGKKAPSKGYDIAGGCLLFIGFGAIVFIFTLMDDLKDLEEYWIQILIVLIVGSSFLFQMFKKKGKLFTYRVELDEHQLKMHDISATREQLQLDIYTNGKDEFVFYHLWDTQGNVVFYSLYNDDLCHYFSEKNPNKTSRHEISDCSFASYENYITTSDKRKLNYDLESGQFTIRNKTETIISFTPKAFAYDGKYKKGIGFSKKNS
jgi:hypothetical protein